MTEEDDIPCDVCKNPECELNNNMIFCDKCNVCVHQVCYGVDRIPEGSWFCKPCEQNIQPSCLFCLQSKGAMKSTSNDKWAHISCTLWIPEVSFAEPEKMETIINIDKIPKTRWTLSCFICRKRGGACIQCYLPKCKTAYHVTCAYQKGLHMVMEDVESSESEVKFESFCKVHTERHSNKITTKDNSPKKARLEKTNIASDDELTQPLFSAANFTSISADTSINTPLMDVETAPLENGNGAFEVPFAGEALVGKKATARKSFPASAQKINKNKRPTGVLFKNLKINRLRVRTKVPKERSAKRKTNQPTEPAESELPPPSVNEPGTPGKKPKLDAQPNETPQDPDTPSTSRDTVSAIRELFPTPTAILQNQQGLVTEPQSPSNNHPPSVSGNQLPLMQRENQTLVVCNNQTPTIATGFQEVPKKDQISSFLGYLESLLRAIPPKKSFKIQGKLISCVLKEHDRSPSFDELSDVSSDSD